MLSFLSKVNSVEELTRVSFFVRKRKVKRRKEKETLIVFNHSHYKNPTLSIKLDVAMSVP